MVEAAEQVIEQPRGSDCVGGTIAHATGNRAVVHDDVNEVRVMSSCLLLSTPWSHGDIKTYSIVSGAHPAMMLLARVRRWQVITHANGSTNQKVTNFMRGEST